MAKQYQIIVFIYLSARRRFRFCPAHTRELITTPIPALKTSCNRLASVHNTSTTQHKGKRNEDNPPRLAD